MSDSVQESVPENADNENTELPSGSPSSFPKVMKFLLTLPLLILQLPAFLLIKLPMIPIKYLLGARVSSDGNNDTVTVYEASLLIYTLPFGWFALICCGLAYLGVPVAILGFVIFIAIPLSWIVLGSDPDRDRVILTIAGICLVLLSFGVIDLGTYVLKSNGTISWSIPIFHYIQEWLTYVNFEFPARLAIGWFVVSLVLSSVSVCYARFENKYLISTRTVDHYRWFKVDDGISRNGTTLRVDWRDAIEHYLGCGSGDIVVRDKNGSDLKRIKNIVGLDNVEEHVIRLNQTYGTTDVAIDDM